MFFFSDPRLPKPWSVSFPVNERSCQPQPRSWNRHQLWQFDNYLNNNNKTYPTRLGFYRVHPGLVKQQESWISWRFFGRKKNWTGPKGSETWQPQQLSIQPGGTLQNLQSSSIQLYHPAANCTMHHLGITFVEITLTFEVELQRSLWIAIFMKHVTCILYMYIQ